MIGRVIPAPFWFVAALTPMVVSQLVRLQQSDPAAWIFWDYAERLGALAVLGAIPAARKVAFKHERLRITGLEIAIWVTGIEAVRARACAGNTSRNLIAGLCLIASPWLLGYQDSDATTVHVVIGAGVAGLAAFEAWIAHVGFRLP